MAKMRIGDEHIKKHAEQPERSHPVLSTSGFWDCAGTNMIKLGEIETSGIED